MVTPLHLLIYLIKAVNNTPINGIINTNIKLQLLPNFDATIQLHILNNQLSSADIIVGRDFIESNKITIIINPFSVESEDRLQLFSDVASADITQ